MINIERLYDKEYAKRSVGNDAFFKSAESEKELGYTEIENGYVLPMKGINGGVADKEGQWVKNTGLHDYLGSSYEFEKGNAKESEETVIYFGALHGVWGHCITDCISRAWFLFSEEYEKKYKGCKIVYSPFEGFKWTQNFKELLELIGIEVEELTAVEEVTRYNKIIIPERSFYNDENGVRYFTKEYREIIKKITDGVKRSEDERYEKIYLTCTHFSRKQIGEEKLEKFFKKQGYSIIAPEEYSFKEQLAMFKRCEFLAATDGSAAHNALFLNKDSTAIMIPRAYYWTGYQRAVVQVSRSNLFYVDSSLSAYAFRKEPWAGPFYFFVSENLLSFFGEEEKNKRFWKKQLKDFKEYYVMAKSREDFEKRTAPDYYVKVKDYYLQKANIKKMPSRFLKLRNRVNAVKRKFKVKFRKTFLKRKIH